MKIAVFLMVLLMFSAATIATVSIASNMSLPVRTSQMQTVLFDADFNDEQPNGDPVEGGGGAPR
jgi:hypothetical protein